MENSIPECGIVKNRNCIPPTIHIKKPSKPIYKQIYRKVWESNPLFQGWLSPVACDKYKAKCTACKKEMLAHRLTLLKHASSAKHLKKFDMTCNSIPNKPQSNNSVTEERKKIMETEAEERITNDMSSNNRNNAMDIFPSLVNRNVNQSQFTDSVTKMKLNNDSLNGIYKEFAVEMEAQISQLTAEEVATNSISLETALPEIQHADTTMATSSVPGGISSIIIQNDSFVAIPDTPKAINFKQGYVTKSNVPQTIVCASTFNNNKTNEPVASNVINKVTTHPPQISTRVTDYSRGISAVNLSVTLYMLTGGKWVSVGQSVTDDVGRCNLFHKNETFFSIGLYKLHYDVNTYYEQQNLKSYFRFIEVVFQVKGLRETHHVPLMISPNGYTAYRSMDY